MRKPSILLCWMLLFFGTATIAGANLVPATINGDPVIIQSNRNFGGPHLMWLEDANFVLSSGFDLTNVDEFGKMTLPEAGNFIGYLNDMNKGAGYAGFNDWRLPSALNADGSGPDVDVPADTTEMGEMYYYEPYASYFTNWEQTRVYWENEQYVPWSGFHCYYNFNAGQQEYKYRWVPSHVLAVRTAPIPGSIWLFGFGIIGLLGIRSRSKS